MIVKKIIVLATFYISLFSLPAQAMNDLSIPLGLTPDKWDKYIENGCLAPHQYAHWVDQVKIFSHNTLLQAILLDPILNEPSTAILAAQLDELPANEIATRY